MTRAKKVLVAGAFAIAALAGPVVAAVGNSAAPELTATNGQCLAWFGSRDDGQCIGYSDGSGTTLGTPNLGVYGPGYGNGIGVSTGPLLPGQTINKGLSP